MPELATLFTFWASLNHWPTMTRCNCGAENAGVERRAFRRFGSGTLSRNAPKCGVRNRPETPHRRRKFRVTRHSLSFRCFAPAHTPRRVHSAGKTSQVRVAARMVVASAGNCRRGFASTSRHARLVWTMTLQIILPRWVPLLVCIGVEAPVRYGQKRCRSILSKKTAT
jgi:hypothetical protein